MLSDAESRKSIPAKRARGVNAKHKHYSDSQKIEAVTTYLALGDLRLTANVLKIGEPTIRYWKSKDWWKEIESELRQAEDLQLSTRLKKIIDKSFEAVEDRLAHGDFVYDQKTGEMRRKPVNLRDAHKVAVDLVDKREVLINKQPLNLSADALDDKLTKLAEKFAEIANKTKAPVIVTDVIVADSSAELNPTQEQAEEAEEDIEDALYEEREEGLQEGK
jgi:hypothetical protein